MFYDLFPFISKKLLFMSAFWLILTDCSRFEAVYNPPLTAIVWHIYSKNLRIEYREFGCSRFKTKICIRIFSFLTFNGRYNASLWILSSPRLHLLIRIIRAFIIEHKNVYWMHHIVSFKSHNEPPSFKTRFQRCWRTVRHEPLKIVRSSTENSTVDKKYGPYNMDQMIWTIWYGVM